MSDQLHKDQQRVQSTVLPFLMALANEAGDPVAERSCTLTNRLFNQGPDPLYLMETVPNVFADLCALLALDVDNGREAIESAHWMGPGVLLEGEGLSDNRDELFELMKGSGGGSLIDGLPVAWRREMLWLILASMSDCTEEGYAETVTVQERIQRATQAAVKLARFVDGVHDRGSVDMLLGAALETVVDFTERTPVELDERGFPHSEGDHAFYVLYKRGYQCVAVETPSLTFWGTVPGTSLADQGVEVNKQISPQFGLVFK